MTTVAEHASNIIDLAATADSLVAQFRQLVADLQVEEAAIYEAADAEGITVPDVIAGRRRLASYALTLAGYAEGRDLPPELSQTVTELATAAWGGFLIEPEDI